MFINHLLRALGSLMVVSFLLTGAALAQQPTYYFSGFVGHFGNDINDLGEMVSSPWSVNPSLDPNLVSLPLPYVLGTPPNPVAINNLGQIAGRVSVYQDRDYGFVYQQGVTTVLDCPGAIQGGAWGGTHPTGINDKGQIVGWCMDNIGLHAFLYDHGTFNKIPAPYPGDAVPADINNFAIPADINNHGDIVGQYQGRAFLFSQGVFTLLDPRMEGATGINDRGQIVGWYSYTIPNVQQPYTNPGILENGIWTPLVDPSVPAPPLISIWASAKSINNRGVILASYRDRFGQVRSGLWRRNPPFEIDLNVNSSVSLAQQTASSKTVSDTTGCPAGFVGKFTFDALLTSRSASVPMLGMNIRVRTLSNGNLLLDPAKESVLGGAGAVMFIRRTAQYSDGLLGPGESVNAPFRICLRSRDPFQFLVDVYDVVVP